MRKLYILGLIGVAVLIIGIAWAEQITFSTYYPAPAGRYREFSTTGKTTLATDEYDIETDEFARVGIGTTAPSGILHVDGGTAASGQDGTNITLKAQDGGWGDKDGGNIILLPGTSGGPVGGADGNVGIGTTDPGTNKLEIVGGTTKTTGGLIIETRDGTDPSGGELVDGRMWLRTDVVP